MASGLWVLLAVCQMHHPHICVYWLLKADNMRQTTMKQLWWQQQQLGTVSVTVKNTAQTHTVTMITSQQTNCLPRLLLSTSCHAANSLRTTASFSSASSCRLRVPEPQPTRHLCQHIINLTHATSITVQLHCSLHRQQ